MILDVLLLGVMPEATHGTESILVRMNLGSHHQACAVV